MLSNSEFGRNGESYAVAYLRSKNYQIIAQNWRYRRAEIDIIAKRKSLFVFVEVKTRSYTYYGQPEDFLFKAQEMRILDASQRFLELTDTHSEFRFDIISVIINRQNGLQKISHFIDAFFF